MRLWSALPQQTQQGFAHNPLSVSPRAAARIEVATQMMGDTVAGRGPETE